MSGLTDEILNSTDGFESNTDTAPAPKEAPKTPEPVEEPSETPAEPGTPEEAADGAPEPTEEAPKPKRTAEDRIKQLARERNEERERVRQLEERLARLETGNRTPELAPANENGPQEPDPTQYEYGSLDDKYIRDMIDFRASQQIAAHLAQRQQEAVIEAQTVAKMDQAKSIVDKGKAEFDDFEEVVWNGGMRQDYQLAEPTFEALTEADNPAAIIYALASDPDEAARVAGMSPVQQAKYVFAKDAELSAAKTPKPRAPSAPPPPGQQVRGASGRFTTPGDTDDLDAFEKEFFKKKR